MKNEPEATKSKLTTQQIDYCMLHMIRDPELFAYARQHLKPTDFSPTGEAYYGVLWAAALDAAERTYGVLPLIGTELIIAMELTSRLDSAGNQITKEASDLSVSLLSWIFQIDSSALNPAYYKPLVQDLIIERTIVGQMKREMNQAQEVGLSFNVIKSLETYNNKLQQVLVDSSKAGDTAFPANFKPKKLGKFSTGQPFFDQFMNGGQAPGEVYVILGPTGLGKTSTGIMLTVDTARVWLGGYLENKIPKPKVSCFFSWEQDLERLRLRFWSYAARVDSTRLESYADGQIELSTKNDLQEYELKEFPNVPADKRMGERERMELATKELAETVRIFDFSGADDNPRVGEGGLDEVVTTLSALQKQGQEIGVVVLDYAGAAIRRYMSARGEDPNGIRHRLANFCNECRFKIALPFKCPVWVLHQLNTESNRRAPTTEQHHSYASECGNFAENAWFAFVFSTKDKANNTCQLFCTKERRSKGDRPAVCLKIEGQFCRMVDVSISHTSNSVTKQIMLKSISNTVVDPKIMKKKISVDRPGSELFGDY